MSNSDSTYIVVNKGSDRDVKIKYILEQLENGVPQKELAESMGYSTSYRITEFMQNQGYKKVNNKFIKNMDIELDTSKITIAPVVKSEIVEDKERTIEHPIESTNNSNVNPTIVLQNQEMQNKLFDMLNNYDSFVEVIKWFNNSGSKTDRGQLEDNNPITKDTTIIEVNTGLQINYNKTQTKKTTVRLDEGIWEEFDNFSNDKYSQFSKQDLISQALREFMDKYK